MDNLINGHGGDVDEKELAQGADAQSAIEEEHAG